MGFFSLSCFHGTHKIIMNSCTDFYPINIFCFTWSVHISLCGFHSFIYIYSYVQPLSNCHSCCYQQSPLHQTDNHEYQGKPMSEPSTSSVYSSQCTDSCKKSPLSSSSLPVKLNENGSSGDDDNDHTTINKQSCKQLNHPDSNDSISVNNCSANHLATTIKTHHTAKVHFIDSTTSTEPSSLSLLFEQKTHNTDPLRSNHVWNITICLIKIVLFEI